MVRRVGFGDNDKPAKRPAAKPPRPKRQHSPQPEADKPEEQPRPKGTVLGSIVKIAILLTFAWSFESTTVRLFLWFFASAEAMRLIGRLPFGKG